MEIKSIKTEFQVFENHNELPADIAHLLEKAREAAMNAYARYSHFKVGAAILLENGEIVIGSNQENAAYPSGTCAERTAAFYASARYPNVPFKKIAVISVNPDKQNIDPTAPCGSCRQVLIEYEQKSNCKLQVIISSALGKTYVFDSAEDILPFSFHAGFLPEEQ